MYSLIRKETEQQVLDHFNELEISGVGYETTTPKVVWHNYVPRDYSQDYLTFTALENGTISFTVFSWFDTSYLTSISYSLNDGEWVTFYNSDGREDNEVIDINVNAGDKIRCKGIAKTYGYYDYNGCVITSTCRFNAYGNIMSLLYGDNFIGETDLSDNDDAFQYLFCDTNAGNECLLINAENLILPATTLASKCYLSMFDSCTSLTTAPELPATTLIDWCYNGMFRGCTSLTKAPELPATTLVKECYNSMFNGCSRLNYIKCLATNISASDCTSNWVNGVSATGTFAKASSMSSWTTGTSGIPSNWTVQDA